MEDLARLRKSRILIIAAADHFHVTAPLTASLSQTHSQIRLTDHEQAMAVYNAWSPDLIIVDLQTHFDRGMAGFVQLRSMVQHAVPMLALMGPATAASSQNVLRQGAKDILILPCDATEALARVRNLLELRHLQQRLNQPHATSISHDSYRTGALHGASSDLCQRLAHILICRDGSTGNHAMRMSRYAAALGRAAGLSAVESDLLQQASPLHDIGKIAIPDRILLKPAPLEPEEWAIMQTHTTIGADLLAGDDSALLHIAHDTALTHHEKWDGSGYPYGLRGETIPLVGRITAICDVFDALTSERPYKPAWPVQDAVDAICQQSGRHFEPRLVKQFYAILPELIAIHARYAAPQTDVCSHHASGLQQGEVVCR